MNGTISPGDWVRFYRNDISGSHLVIGVVQYVSPERLEDTDWKADIITDYGSVDRKWILEVRRGPHDIG